MNKRKWRRVWLCVRLGLKISLVLLLAVALYTLFDPIWYRATPNDKPGFKWTCEEQDMYFLVDKHGRCYGEATVNGERKFIYFASDTRGYFIITEIMASSWDEVRIARSGENLLSGWDDYDRRWAKRFTAIILPGDCYAFGELTEPVRLHFTREKLREQFCFDGEDCSQCARERRKRPYG